jgi:hypothetical protein
MKRERENNNNNNNKEIQKGDNNVCLAYSKIKKWTTRVFIGKDIRYGKGCSKRG